MTPVPLELPVGPAEAADLANLIFGHAEGKPLSDELRNRLAARAAALQLQTFSAFFGSLERDPVHASVYYLAVDGVAGVAGNAAKAPLLLHMAPAAAPTSSIYPRPLLICRMRRSHGQEIVINAIHFGPDAPGDVEGFAARINSAFFPQPQGARATITVEEDYPAAFETFRAIRKRTGKNFAALSGDYHAAMWAAIRAGWRSGYTLSADLTAEGSSVTNISQAKGFSRYAVVINATGEGFYDGEKIYHQIRRARAAMKISRGFDLELDSANPMTPEFLRSALDSIKGRGHLPQLVCPGPVAEKDLDEMAAIAQYFQITLSFRYRGEPGETVRTIAKAMSGRLNYRVRNAAEAEFVAEHLL